MFVKSNIFEATYILVSTVLFAEIIEDLDSRTNLRYFKAFYALVNLYGN